jgi:hypothetical protein
VITDQQSFNGFHRQASENLLFAVSDTVFILLHYVVKFLQNLCLVDGFGVLHLGHDGRVT